MFTAWRSFIYENVPSTLDVARPIVDRPKTEWSKGWGGTRLSGILATRELQYQRDKASRIR